MTVLVAALPSATSGCQVCDSSVCSSTLWVYFDEPGGGPLQEGTYELSVRTDERQPQSATCEVAAGAEAVSCEGLDFILYAPREGSPTQPHEVLHLYYQDAPPTTVSVTITHDGATIFEGTLEPEYALAEPGCDDDCRHATERRDFAR